jgi:hypothetical protein
MASLKDTAKGYVPKQTKNIADLDVVSVELDVKHDGQGIDNDGKEFIYSYVELNGEEYRVPNSVVGQLKDILDENPNLSKFKVKRTGEGLKTRYTLIPLV